MNGGDEEALLINIGADFIEMPLEGNAILLFENEIGVEMVTALDGTAENKRQLLIVHP